MLVRILLVAVAICRSAGAAPIEHASSHPAIGSDSSLNARSLQVPDGASVAASSILVVPLGPSTIDKTKGGAIATPTPAAIVQPSNAATGYSPTAEPTFDYSLPSYPSASAANPQTYLPAPNSGYFAPNIYSPPPSLPMAYRPSPSQPLNIAVSTQPTPAFVTVTAPQYPATPTITLSNIEGIPVSVQPDTVYLTAG